MANYEVWLDDPQGQRLALLDRIISLDAVKVANKPGALALALPAEYDNLLRLDGMIEVWRRGEEGGLKLFNVYQVRGWDLAEQQGTEITVLRGQDGNALPWTRTVAYAAGTANASKTTYADDMMKAYVSENCATAATDTGRIIPGFTVAANASAAPSITVSASYRNLGEVLLDIAEASRKEGTRLYFDTVPVIGSDGGITYQFRTYINQPGQDLTGDAQVFFGRAFGNLEGAELSYDYSTEVTVVYALGQGTGADRVVTEVEDTTRSGASVYGRREASYNVSGQASTTAAYTAAGNARLTELRPRLRFSGSVQDTKQARFGIDWNWGDRVVVSARGRQYDAVITSISLRLDGEGKETLAGTFEVLE